MGPAGHKVAWSVHVVVVMFCLMTKLNSRAGEKFHMLLHKRQCDSISSKTQHWEFCQKVEPKSLLG